MAKTAMTELIEELNKFSPNGGDNDVSKAFNEGIQWAIIKAKNKIEKERQQIIDSYNSGAELPNAAFLDGEEYFTQTYNQ